MFTKKSFRKLTLISSFLFVLNTESLTANDRPIVKVEAGEGIFLSQALEFETNIEKRIRNLVNKRNIKFLESSEGYSEKDFPITGKLRKIKSSSFLYLYRWSKSGILLNVIIIDISDPNFLENQHIDEWIGIDKNFKQFLEENLVETK